MNFMVKQSVIYNFKLWFNYETKLGSIGKPVPGHNVRLVNKEGNFYQRKMKRSNDCK